MSDATEIRWPDHYHPRNTAIHVRNEIDIAAAPEIVWSWLIRAQRWPTWYVNSANVQFVDGAPSDLALGTRFKWRTFGASIESTVQEFVSNERIAWNGKAFGVDVYHAWLIVKTPQGCKVITEESQRGFMTRLSALVFPKRMWKFHQFWLAGLRDRAEAGTPPSA